MGMFTIISQEEIDYAIQEAILELTVEELYSSLDVRVVLENQN